MSTQEQTEDENISILLNNDLSEEEKRRREEWALGFSSYIWYTFGAPSISTDNGRTIELVKKLTISETGKITW